MSDGNAMAPGLETLAFRFDGRQTAGSFATIVVGVVGSGNLEVMVEPGPGTDCTVPAGRLFGNMYVGCLLFCCLNCLVVVGGGGFCCGFLVFVWLL